MRKAKVKIELRIDRARKAEGPFRGGPKELSDARGKGVKSAEPFPLSNSASSDNPRGRWFSWTDLPFNIRSFCSRGSQPDSKWE